ncbi:MAG: 1-phosphofructokinase family hexose kinase [Defluviitaleaceae bacterium]|nr:1-phosphofructokinase family hexose kinase [Defluviitaleaceae bacterium]
MPPITIVNLNPCIDWQYNVPTFAYGGMNRVRRTYASAASKGTNVAVVLKNLGQAPCCVGFNFAEGGQQVIDKFDSIGIAHDFDMLPGAVRVNIKLYEETTGTMTELNQPGAFVPEIYVHRLEAKVGKLQSKDGILVLSGSLPAGVPPNIYARLAGLWQGKVYLDAEGEPLRLALAAGRKPYAIKPNLYELESVFGVKLPTPKAVADFCRENIHGVPVICVSMGAAGAVLVTPGGAYFSPALNIPVKGVQGAGDSMVAGLIHGELCGMTAPDLLRFAMAAAAGSVIRDGTDLCRRGDFCAMLENLPPPQVL